MTMDKKKIWKWYIGRPRPSRQAAGT